MTLGGLYAFLLTRLSKGPVDEYYMKFTQPADGLVLGLSRADQGVVPEIVADSLLPSDQEFRMVNFAMNQTFYGRAYLEAIRKKLREQTREGIFILSVNPGSFTASKGFNPDEIQKFDEKTILGKLSEVSADPNYDYLSCCYGSSLYNVIYNTSVWDHFVFHADGWNEVVLKTSQSTISEGDIRHWTALNLRFYKLKLKTEEFNPYRLEYLVKTIDFLKSRGKVYMVRMPAAADIIALENEQWSQFDILMDSVAQEEEIAYLNFTLTPDIYMTYDGSHLFSQSARKFTADLAFKIKSLN
jgi:hypothetical protein